MKNFVSVIFDNDEINETLIVESMKSSAGMALTESETVYGLFETVDNKIALQLRISRELSESESDLFAKKLASKLFDQGYNNFDIEVSVNESVELLEADRPLNLNDYKQQIEAAGPYTVNAAGNQVTMRDGSGTVAGVNQNGNLWSGSDIISQIVRRGITDSNRPTGPGSPSPAPGRPSREASGSLAAFAQSGEGGIANNPEETEAIRELQDRLRAAGFDPGATDGRYGPRTSSAVRQFQQANNLSVDGDAGPQTIQALLAAAAAEPTAAEPTASEPEAEPEAEPTASEPEAEPEAEPTASEPEAEPEAEPTAAEPEAEPEAEPTASEPEAEPEETAPEIPTDQDLTSFRNALGLMASNINPQTVEDVGTEIEQLGQLSVEGRNIVSNELTNTYSVEELIEAIQEARTNNEEIEGAFDLLNLYRSLDIDIPTLEFDIEPMLLRDNFNVGDQIIIGGRTATVSEVGGEKFFQFDAEPEETEGETAEQTGSDSVDSTEGPMNFEWTITKDGDTITGTVSGTIDFTFTVEVRGNEIYLDTDRFDEPTLFDRNLMPNLYNAIQTALNESVYLDKNPLLEEFNLPEETYDGDDFFEAYGVMWFNEDDELDEAEYQGRKVKLGKPMRGDVKKFKVYVRNPKGNVVKVNFGDPDMRIKKSNPARRRSFRARHNCDNPGPRHKARYWSCRKW